MIDGKTIFAYLMTFIGSSREVFPLARGVSWTPTLTAFFYKLGTTNSYEVRCGDYFAYLARIRAARKLAALPNTYDDLCRPWITNNVRAHGLLAIDACWVPVGFSIPRSFSTVPVPQTAEIVLAYEHEDEGTLYTDKRGTNLNVVLDEVRKIGNVKSTMKVLSYITSRTEAASQAHIDSIAEEIKRVPCSEQLTQEWFVIQIAKYEQPKSRKSPIQNPQMPGRLLYCQGTSLDGKGSIQGVPVNQLVRFPQ